MKVSHAGRPEEKAAKYRELAREVEAVLGEERDPLVWMATLACLIRQKFEHFWVGFYRVSGGQLVIGPYQGTLGCLRIDFSRGVCGASARSKKTVIVPDVHRFEGHIACDSRSNSEIVVPVFDDRDRLCAVLDIDSIDFGAFDTTDQKYLERIVHRMRGLAWTEPA